MRIRRHGEESVERLLSENEIANTVLATHRECDQLVVVAPVSDANGQPQLWVSSREATTDVALRTHVLHKGGEPGERLAFTLLPLQPVSTSTEKVQDTMPVRVAMLVDAKYGDTPTKTGDLPRQRILGRPGQPKPTDT